MSRSGSGRRVVYVLGLATAVICALAVPAGARTPVPSVVGPLPVTADSYPFGVANHSSCPRSGKQGYVEEEYLVSGTANVYDWPAGGPAVVRTPDAPYTTRVVVRRPANPRRFSGNVVVEMLIVRTCRPQHRLGADA